jgi:ribonucleoside-diphosphate reductase alpha chain
LNAVLTWDGGKFVIDFERLRDLTDVAIRFLDRSIDVADFILPEIQAFEQRHRPLGLGVMGLADVLALMGIPYGSSDARDLLQQILGVMKKQAHDTAAEAGQNNATFLSIAPTGTIAMLAGAAYSIEPYFKLAYNKTGEAGVFPVIEPALEMALMLRDIALTE